MDLFEILIVVSSGLLVILTILVVIGLFIKKPKRDVDLSDLEKHFKDDMNQSILSLNGEINKQFMNLSDQSGKNMTDLRVKVNEQLGLFQEKMTDRFNLEFKDLILTFQTQMQKINAKVEERLDKGFRDANATFIDIAKRVEVIDEAQKNIKSLSEEMVSLQNILSDNQARGAYGEYQLNQLLSSIYGQNDRLYQTQYTLKHLDKTVRADAVIFMPKPNAMIAIDSKFPYATYAKLFSEEGLSKEDENKLISQFGREVKKHITDIASKYIMPPVTTDYALMFVPSDGILSLIHSQLNNVVQYARDKSVTIVSPTTIIPLLSSFKAFVIDYERSKHMDLINQELMKLGRDFKIFDEEWSKLSRTIQTIKTDSEKIDSRVVKMTSKFDKIKEVGVVKDE